MIIRFCNKVRWELLFEKSIFNYTDTEERRGGSLRGYFVDLPDTLGVKLYFSRNEKEIGTYEGCCTEEEFYIFIKHLIENSETDTQFGADDRYEVAVSGITLSSGKELKFNTPVLLAFCIEKPSRIRGFPEVTYFVSTTLGDLVSEYLSFFNKIDDFCKKYEDDPEKCSAWHREQRKALFTKIEGLRHTSNLAQNP